jgi:hypothetical protein
MRKSVDSCHSFECDGRGNAARQIQSELLCLMRRIEACIQFGGLAMATAGSHNEEFAEDCIILDDVTPRHATAVAALNACHSALGEALCHFLKATVSGILPPHAV